MAELHGCLKWGADPNYKSWDDPPSSPVQWRPIGERRSVTAWMLGGSWGVNFGTLGALEVVVVVVVVLFFGGTRSKRNQLCQEGFLSISRGHGSYSNH